MFLHYPTEALGSNGAPNTRLPFVVHVHGGGFNFGEAEDEDTAMFQKFTRAGYAVVSVDYRVVTTDFFYNDASGHRRAEELIEVDADGRMALATDGRVMRDWAILGSRVEHATKCVFDVVVAMDYLVDNAELLGLDTEQVNFKATSAGSMAVNYLLWSYPLLSPGRYRPRAAMLKIAQFDYPIHVGAILHSPLLATETDPNVLLDGAGGVWSVRGEPF